MTATIDDGLVDRIYEASFLTERWKPLLGELCDISGCSKAVLFANDGPSVGRWLGTDSIVEFMEAYSAERWAARDALTARSFGARSPEFITTYDLFAPGEFEKEEAFEGLYQRFDMGSSTGSVISAPEDNIISFGLHRSRKLGPVSEDALGHLNLLRPHLARSALASARMRLEQARIALNALNALRLPAATLSISGRLRQANQQFEALIPKFVQDGASHLRLADTAADHILREAVTRGQSMKTGRYGRTIPAKGIGPNERHVVHLMPITGDTRDIFSASFWLLMIIPVEINDNVNVRLIESLFDFTPSEAQVARGIAAGLSLHEIAHSRHSSVETVRTQLRGIMAKTGTNRQLDLVRLLSSTQRVPHEE